MVKKSPKEGSISSDTSEDKPKKKKLPANYYFDNDEVERLLIEYHKTSCTSVALRDQIMGHASELIVNVIRTHNLHTIYGGKDESSFNDLFQIAWAQIESTLYKFDSSPGHAKIFNMWSQISRTVILAAIKKNSRDKKNAESYRLHLDSRAIRRPVVLDRFMTEARDLCKYNDEHMYLLDVLEKLYNEDERPHEGLIGKLTEKSELSRAKIARFVKTIRLLSFEFTDSTIGAIEHQEQIVKPSQIAWCKDED